MFSFFRKHKTEDLMAYLKEGLPNAKEGPAYAPVKPKAATESGIEVMEAVGGLAPEFEEAAVLFANGKIGDTATLLNRYLLDHPENRDPLPWYMLFDLYEATNQRAPFEDAAVEFAVKFERSPPTWHPRSQGPTASAPAPLMAYGEKYGSLERVKQPKFFQDAANAPYVRLDVTRLQTPDEETATAILGDIHRLHAMGKPIELIGGPGLAVRLDALRQAGHLKAGAWLFLLEILRLMGKEEGFDNVAVDYAVAFEVSPPAYSPPRPLPGRAEALVNEQATPQGNTFCLTGVITPGTDAQIRELKRFAEGKKEVDVDMSDLSRIDFAVVGMLLELVIELEQKGCHVTLREGNELINTLLQIVGVSQFATLKPRKRA